VNLACGKEPVTVSESQAPAAVYTPLPTADECFNGVGTIETVTLPNDCNVAGNFCVYLGLVYNEDGRKLFLNECVRDLLVEQGKAPEVHGW
jgi:hypothetical protein